MQYIEPAVVDLVGEGLQEPTVTRDDASAPELVFYRKSEAIVGLIFRHILKGALHVVLVYDISVALEWCTD